MFLTDARELGAREVAPDALLVKLPKKKRKIKKSNKSEENPENRKKVLVDPGRHFPVPYLGAFGLNRHWGPHWTSLSSARSSDGTGGPTCRP